MMPPKRVDDLLGRIADGDVIDWSTVAAEAATAEDSALFEELRIVARLGAVHRPLRRQGADADPAAAAAQKTLEGRFWGRYRLLRLLGEGSYGAVFLAYDPELDRRLAIKLLHPFVAASDRSRKVREEGQKLARIPSDANVVKVYDVESHEGQLGLCMQYIDGHTLDERVRRDGPLNAEEAITVGRAVCRALAAVHAAGLVHRDVKARNVMRERAGRYVLMDLGAGMHSGPSADRAASAVAGTPLYMAPELFEGAPGNAATDTYACGVLLYFLVTGEYPVWGETVDELVRAHRQGRGLSLEAHRLDLPDTFVRVVERATSPRPENRYATALELLKDLGGSPSGSGTHRLVDVVPQPIGWRARALTIVKVALAVTGLAIVSGHLTAWAFNIIVGRPSAFDSDGFVDRMSLGFSSLAWPAVSMVFALAGLAIAQILVRIVRWIARLVPGASSLRPRMRIPEPQRAAFFGQLFVLVGIAAATLVYFQFGDVLLVFGGSLIDGNLDKYAPLRDANRDRRLAYRMVTAALVLGLSLGWETVRRVRLRAGGAIPVWQVSVGALLAVLVFAASQMPYKVMTRNRHPAVSIAGQRCYLLGRNGEDVCTYCPGSEAPRVRVGSLSRLQLVECGFEENIFEVTTLQGCNK